MTEKEGLLKKDMTDVYYNPLVEGKSYYSANCPFCGCYMELTAWSASGNGKRCHGCNSIVRMEYWGKTKLVATFEKTEYQRKIEKELERKMDIESKIPTEKIGYILSNVRYCDDIKNGFEYITYKEPIFLKELILAGSFLNNGEKEIFLNLKNIKALKKEKRLSNEIIDILSLHLIFCLNPSK